MSVPYEMLLHPELLTNEQLIYVIHERYLRIPNMEKMPRDELLELFHQFCVPYGQRKYRDSGRGKILNKTRNVSPVPVPRQIVTDNYQSRKSSLSNCKRIKPPPDLLTGHTIKKMKSENATSTLINQSINKRKVTNDMMTPGSDSPPTKRDRKQITWP